MVLAFAGVAVDDQGAVGWVFLVLTAGLAVVAAPDDDVPVVDGDSAAADDAARCTDARPSPPVSFCPAANTITVDLPALRGRLLQAQLPLVENRALPGYLRFYVKDPAGNQLEFLEPDNELQETTP